MKDKNVPIHSSDASQHSPFNLHWPEKKVEKRDVEQKESSSSKHSKASPDLLFHTRKRGSGLGITFFLGRQFSLKAVHVALYAIFLTVLVLPFQVYAIKSTIDYEKSYLISQATKAEVLWKHAYASLKENDFTAAEASFAEAATLFSDMAEFPRKQHPIVVSLLETLPYTPKQYDAYKDIVMSGYLISKAGKEISSEAQHIKGSGISDMKETIGSLEQTVHAAANDVMEAHFRISRINPSVLPDAAVEEFTSLQRMFDNIIGQVANADRIASLIASMAGLDTPKLWLVVFQNDAELRASGGFMGSYALAKMEEGELQLLDIPSGGTYDFRGSFRKNVIAPQPLHLINPVWEFQDSNWWPDWPTTAEKIIWFYEQGNGATVDGVVSFTPALLERVLDITGPVEIQGAEDEYGVAVDKYNVYDVLQTFSERKLDETKEPKKIIGDLASTIVDTTPHSIGADESLDLLSLIVDSIEQRQLLVYWNDDAGQQVLEENGFDGSLVNEDTNDYLMVVHTNIAGGKSDKSIKDVVSLDSRIQNNGTVINTLTLTRTHHGKEGTGFSGVRNVDYVRFYVPEGSRLMSAKGFTKPNELLFEEPPEGFTPDEDYLAVETNKRYDEKTGTEIFDSFGKTVFAHWLMVDPGESQTVTLQYVLPQTIRTQPESYTVYIQKQPGWQGAQVDYSLSWPEVWKPVLVNGLEPGTATSVQYKANLTKDIRLTTEWENNIYAKK